MKICKNCNMGYNDNVNVCPNCGNRNLIYFNKNMGSHTNTGPVNTSFKFGELIKNYFKIPTAAKKEAGTRGDIGSAFIILGITLVMYFIYTVCLQGGISIRAHYSIFSVAVTLLFPILMFILVIGLQYVDVLLYSVYVKNRTRSTRKTALPIFVFLSAGRFIPCMIIFLASLFSLVSPTFGIIILYIAIALSLYSSIIAKIEYGMKPQTFLDHFMFVLTGVMTFFFAIGIIALVTYISVRIAASSAIGSLYDSIGGLGGYGGF